MQKFISLAILWFATQGLLNAQQTDCAPNIQTTKLDSCHSKLCIEFPDSCIQNCQSTAIALDGMNFYPINECGICLTPTPGAHFVDWILGTDAGSEVVSFPGNGNDFIVNWSTASWSLNQGPSPKMRPVIYLPTYQIAEGNEIIGIKVTVIGSKTLTFEWTQCCCPNKKKVPTVMGDWTSYGGLPTGNYKVYISYQVRLCSAENSVNPITVTTPPQNTMSFTIPPPGKIWIDCNSGSFTLKKDSEGNWVGGITHPQVVKNGAVIIQNVTATVFDGCGEVIYADTACSVGGTHFTTPLPSSGEYCVVYSVQAGPNPETAPWYPCSPKCIEVPAHPGTITTDCSEGGLTFNKCSGCSDTYLHVNISPATVKWDGLKGAKVVITSPLTPWWETNVQANQLNQPVVYPYPVLNTKYTVLVLQELLCGGSTTCCYYAYPGAPCCPGCKPENDATNEPIIADRSLQTDGFVMNNVFAVTLLGNPITDETLKVRFQNTAETGVMARVFNQSGRLVRQKLLASDEGSINMAGLPAGIYVLHTISGENSAVVEFMMD